MQDLLLWAAGAAVLVAVAAGVMERVRQRRRHVAGVGWMPWSGVTVAALFVAAMCLGVGLRG
ncbi:hypothetical protein [Sphingomonas prati]|uniref:Uncharacterized protein n=1 Tax=Sphingomonas prati TaxID=1843237 RepID=A0A7W9F2T0_9SPHN|nr:hypothetical protein [Sphingomonas prati]MBB5730651.1 hypothetical protein [Sphingomonas prati]GGE96265.1 hypothetical protein GCM10011404_31760 [Sphingomonas prati]